jgi:ABC-type multidrug transport system ATPase subunit
MYWTVTYHALLTSGYLLFSSGFFPPTSGTAVVNGYDVVEDIDNVRSSLGLCPQHNVLFDQLTVEEHLYFFTKVGTCCWLM